jgi:hypothetical protein
VEHDEDREINDAFEKMKISGHSHPDEKYQQVFYIESPEEEKASASNPIPIYNAQLKPSIKDDR